MREIKFRQFLNHKTRKWHYFDLITHCCNIHDYPVICQFTGLKDKDSIKIFEKDIVKIQTGDLPPKPPYNVEIIFKEEGGYFGMRIDKFETCRLPCDKDCWEVIGNIYENPELLGAK